MKCVWLSALFCVSWLTVTYGDEGGINDIVASSKEGPEGASDDIQKIDNYGRGTVEQRGELINHLFGKYDKRNYPSNMSVRFGFALISFDLDQDKNSFDADIWMRMAWTDSRLTWEKRKFGHIQTIIMPQDEVWKPDTALYNSADPVEGMKCGTPNVHVDSTGEVLWVPQCHVRARCDHNLLKDPFGPQNCSLKFGSWTFDGLYMQLDFYRNRTQAQLDDFVGSHHWDLISNEAFRTEKFYPCCPEPYYFLTFNFTIQRKSSYSAEKCKI